MSRISLCDNDVLLKGCCFDLPTATFVSLSEIGNVYVLGAAKFVVSSRIAKAKGIQNRGLAAKNLDLFIKSACVVEPTDDELTLASAFEEEAQKENLALDSGESTLLAILCMRAAKALVTGDKRAIVSIEGVRNVREMAPEIDGRIACLEQVFFHFRSMCSTQCLRDRVCNNPDTDKTLAICFSCKSGSFSESGVVDGLTSYIDNLRRSAPNVLAKSYDLSGVIS